MKYVKLFLVLAVVVNMTGCATATIREGMLNLDTFPKTSVLAKEEVRLIERAVAQYRTGKYDEALAAIGRAIELKNYGTMGMRLEVEKRYDGIMWIRPITVVSVEKGGAADKVDIKVGDKFGIREIKTHKLSTRVVHIREYINGMPPGTPVEIWTFREGFFALPKKKTIIVERFKDPALPLKLGIKACMLARTGNMQEALKYATESLDSEQSNENSEHWAKTALGIINIGNGNYDEATKLLAQVKNSATVRILEATAHAKLGNTQKAVDIYLAIAERDLFPKHVPRWSDRTALLEELKPFAASKRENAARLKAQGKYRAALSALGDALKVAEEAQGREILKTMAEILRVEPQLARVPEEARKYTLRGDMLTEEGNFKEAVLEYRKAVQVAPYIAKFYFNTAMVYGELQSYLRAVRYMETYLLLAPEAPNARAAQDQIYKWEFKIERGSKG